MADRNDRDEVSEADKRGGNVKSPKRRLGLLAGRADIPDDFDAPLPDEVLDSFEGR